MSGTYRIVEHYARRQHFDLYRQFRCPFYDVTFDLDVSALRAFARQREQSFYATLCYFFTTAMAQVEDFLYRFVDGRIVLYDQLNVSMTVPAPDGCFSFSHVAYDADLERFYASARREMEEAQRRITLSERDWPNTIFFTALPGVPFTGFRHAPDDNPTAGEPRVAFGRFREDSGRFLIPTCVQVNHAFIDGRALGDLVASAEALFTDPGVCQSAVVNQLRP